MDNFDSRPLLFSALGVHLLGVYRPSAMMTAA